MRNKYLKNVFRIYSFYLVSNHLECMLYLLLCYINFLCHSCFGILTNSVTLESSEKQRNKDLNYGAIWSTHTKLWWYQQFFLSNYLSVNLYMFINIYRHTDICVYRCIYILCPIYLLCLYIPYAISIYIL